MHINILFEKRLGYEIDINTGVVLNEYADNLDSLHELRRQILQNEPEEQQNTISPEIFSKGQDNVEVENIIQEITGENTLEGWTEYLLHKNVLLLSCYQKENISESATLKNIFTLYDIEHRETLFQEIIMKGAQVPSPDTFFVKDDFVYFIENQNTLAALNPWKS